MNYKYFGPVDEESGAPLGVREKIMTPWGSEEICMVVGMPDFSGVRVKYATVLRPKGNPGVRFSTFRVG
jgi:hypothetical protein